MDTYTLHSENFIIRHSPSSPYIPQNHPNSPHKPPFPPIYPPFFTFLAMTPVVDLIETCGFREDLPWNSKY